jgi:hypothetical protein
VVVFESEMLRSSRPLAAGAKRLASRALTIGLPIAALVALAAVSYGLEAGQRTLALLALAVGLVIALATTLRGHRALRGARRSLDLLNRALVEAEQARRDLHAENGRLERQNLELRMVQIAVAHGFILVDERTQGRLRQIVTQAGDDLAALVDEALDS